MQALEAYSTGYLRKNSGYSKRICPIKDNLELDNGFFKFWTSLSGRREIRRRFDAEESVSHDCISKILEPCQSETNQTSARVCKIVLV